MIYQSALITGASSGIGAAFARALPHSTDLLLTGRDATQLRLVADSVRAKGRKVETLLADLAQDQGRQTVIAVAQEARIDLLINNAGLGVLGRVLDHDPALERAMMVVNMLAPAVLTRALLPAMLERAQKSKKRPAVILTASLAGFMPLPYFATYAASKSFDLHYAEALAEEMRGQVDVLALCPGPVRTRFGERAGMKARLERIGMEPDYIATAALKTLGRRSVRVIGFVNQIATLAPRFFPRAWLRFLAGRSVKNRS